MKYTLNQQKEHRREWIKALRSGDFQQTKGVLYNPENKGFCCLGVACIVAGLKMDDIREHVTLHAFMDVMNYYGLLHGDGDFFGGNLASLNDDGASFLRMSQIIENEPEGLFMREIK